MTTSNDSGSNNTDNNTNYGNNTDISLKQNSIDPFLRSLFSCTTVSFTCSWVGSRLNFNFNSLGLVSVGQSVKLLLYRVLQLHM